MGRINIDLDLFCSGCSNSLEVDEGESAGHHVMIKPCTTCLQYKVDQTAIRVKSEVRQGERRKGEEEEVHVRKDV